jgi:hypothetical protein
MFFFEKMGIITKMRENFENEGGIDRYKKRNTECLMPSLLKSRAKGKQKEDCIYLL